MYEKEEKKPWQKIYPQKAETLREKTAVLHEKDAGWTVKTDA